MPHSFNNDFFFFFGGIYNAAPKKERDFVLLISEKSWCQWATEDTLLYQQLQ